MIHDFYTCSEVERRNSGWQLCQAAIWTLPPCWPINSKKDPLSWWEKWLEPKSGKFTGGHSWVHIEMFPSLARERERGLERNTINKLVGIKLAIFQESAHTGFLKAWHMAHLYGNHPKYFIQIQIPGSCLRGTKLESWSTGPWNLHFQKEPKVVLCTVIYTHWLWSAK